jgi:UDP-N-acetylglucosamine 2-epimerase
VKKDFLCDLKFYRIINGYFDITVKDQNYKIIYPDHKKNMKQRNCMFP